MLNKDVVYVQPWVKLLILLMPLHNLIFATLISGDLDNIWRDVILILILGIMMVLLNGNFSLGRLGIPIILSWTICVIYLILSDRTQIAANIARTYIVPTIIYFIIVNLKFSEAQIIKIENIFIKSATLLSIWGIFQAFILGDKFLVNIGYESIGGHLASNSFYISNFFGVQRTVSTFASPNICGAYFGMAIIVLLMQKPKENFRLIYLGILSLGLLTTFSRSAIIGTFIALLIVYRHYIFKFKINPVHVFGIILIVIFALIIDYLFLGGLIMKMQVSSFSSILGFVDPSASKHLTDLWEPIQKIISNPLGLGLGHNGPMVAEQFTDSNLVESSIYLLMYDFGILGGILFLCPYIFGMITTFRKDNTLYKGGAICILVLVTYVLLPNVQSYEILFFTFLFLGLDEVRFNHSLDELNDVSCLTVG